MQLQKVFNIENFLIHGINYCKSSIIAQLVLTRVAVSGMVIGSVAPLRETLPN